MLSNHSARLVLPLFLFTATTFFFSAAKAATVDRLSTKFLEQSSLTMQLGGYWRTPGHQQHINIESLIGDNFVPSSAVSKQDSNGLVGVGYFIDAQNTGPHKISYGLNWFYLAPTTIAGVVYQENLFDNLTFSYKTTHFPLYAVAKSTSLIPGLQQEMTFNLGIGPNFMRANHFNEQAIPNGDALSIPEQIFSDHTSTTFSATAGLGIKFNNVLGKTPLECGYQFFYLGQGNLKIANDQVLNSLHTGSLFANALICAIAI